MGNVSDGFGVTALPCYCAPLSVRWRGLPIRDATVDSLTGELANDTGFLRAERYLLEDRGWTYDPKTTLWSPP